jgi:hypothetical protein
MASAGTDGTGLGMFRRMNDDLILELGDRDRFLAVGAGALLAGKLIGDAKAFQATRTGDWDRHGVGTELGDWSWG